MIGPRLALGFVVLTLFLSTQALAQRVEARENSSCDADVDVMACALVGERTLRCESGTWVAANDCYGGYVCAPNGGGFHKCVRGDGVSCPVRDRNGCGSREHGYRGSVCAAGEDGANDGICVVADVCLDDGPRMRCHIDADTRQNLSVDCEEETALDCRAVGGTCIAIAGGTDCGERRDGSTCVANHQCQSGAVCYDRTCFREPTSEGDSCIDALDHCPNGQVCANGVCTRASGNNGGSGGGSGGSGGSNTGGSGGSNHGGSGGGNGAGAAPIDPPAEPAGCSSTSSTSFFAMAFVFLGWRRRRTRR